MQINLNELEIRILLKCAEKNFTKGHLTQVIRKYSLLKKQKAIKSLAVKNLIEIRLLPKPGCKKSPTFYSLTIQGKRWIEDYKKNYPIT